MQRNQIMLIFCLAMLMYGCRKDKVHWQLVQRIETGSGQDRFNRIFFLNDTVGFVVGGSRFDHSTILRTIDGGQHWQMQHIVDAPKGLYGICASPDGKLFAIGFDGKLLRSNDLGQSWELYQIAYLPYKDVCMLNAKQGLAIGGISFVTGFFTRFDSAGSYSAFDSLSYELNDIEMVSENIGYMAGNSTIFRTNNGGQNWIPQVVKNDDFTAIHAYPDGNVWTCGYSGSIWNSSDFGLNWHCVRNGNNFLLPRYRLLDIVFFSSQVGFAVGENGTFITTDDGGLHWMEMDKFTSEALRSIYLTKQGDLFVCGDSGGLFRIKPKLF
ncbi:MAG: hypothetical protein JSS64_03365 [Bacteroidetes bacterium]|nr:hypothetical protein [Bacteroidota bacterium]